MIDQECECKRIWSANDIEARLAGAGITGVEVQENDSAGETCWVCVCNSPNQVHAVEEVLTEGGYTELKGLDIECLEGLPKDPLKFICVFE